MKVLAALVTAKPLYSQILLRTHLKMLTWRLHSASACVHFSKATSQKNHNYYSGMTGKY